MMAEHGQLRMWAHSGHAAPQRAPHGFNVVVDHRTLLESLQDEWLPPPDGTGHLLRARGIFAEHGQPQDSRRRIEVTLRFSPESLPRLEVLAFCDGVWAQTSIRDLPPETSALWWPGPLPLNSMTTACVASVEEQIRLQNMAHQVSNVDLPTIQVGRITLPHAVPLPAESERQALHGIAFSPAHDRIRGAAAMAWWALPRMPPWFDFLTTSLGGSDAALASTTTALDAPWLVSLPWREKTLDNERYSLNAALWRAAMGVLAGWHGQNSRALLDAIVQAARRFCDDHEKLEVWAEQTRNILLARAQIDIQPDATEPVCAALQLVLARSEPDRYKTWSADKSIPPAVWWSGALLSGALSGYRRLPRSFRGEQPLRAFMALYLSSQPTDGASVEWYHCGQGTQFMCGETVLAKRSEGPRGAWYTVDLGDEPTAAMAIREAKRLRWPCVQRVVCLAAGTRRWSGSGSLSVRGTELGVGGTVGIVLTPEDTMTEVLEVHAFRRCLLTWGGEIHAPSPDARRLVNATRSTPPPHQVAPNVPEVPGLIYHTDFLSPEEQTDVLRAVDGGAWSNVLKRRVQHYGWRYDYKARRVSKDMKIGHLPPWADRLAHRLYQRGLMPWVPDQLIVNEYLKKQGISAHIDQPEAFEEAIAMISLVEAWHMRFRPNRSSKTRFDHLLERGSVAVMTGPARYEWTHEIPARVNENGHRRKRRVSLTFRRVRTSV